MKKDNEKGHSQVGISADSAIKSLIDTIEKSSKATIRLTEKIKFLNCILVIIGIIGLIFGAFSIYLQFFRK
jgi:hypothetical protein